MPIRIGKNCYISKSSVLIGDIEIGDFSMVMENAVIRGDLNRVIFGNYSNIQDNATIHVDFNHEANIGDNVSIGHNAVVHGSTIEDNVIIGMGAIIMNGAVIKSGSVVAAGTVVTENFKGEENALIIGVPGKIKRTGNDLLEYAKLNASSYQNLRVNYLDGKYDIKYGGR
ncbi:gamma carbonic anhydrase family protein [Oxyplasma meridianum]|uniref:Gamma carbonic anhydrase family protein n=1 Tax=Oxyplasma meridianum TaxID=3073602 RepID=A0AAX4NFH4_9ARCH